LSQEDTAVGIRLSTDLGGWYGGKMEKEHGRSNRRNPIEVKPELVKTDTADGAAVLKEVVQMTGLPEAYLDNEITQFLGTTQQSVNNLTLDQLSSVLLNYLETVNEEMKQELGKH
jgi:hypothetical protein